MFPTPLPASTPLEISQVVWWDETHRKCTIGGFSASRNISYKFRRDKNGKLSENGEYSSAEVSILNCKYEKEGRFGLGCAVLALDDGEMAGRVCRPFTYSGKTILSIDDFQKQMKNEFERVRHLSTKIKTWTMTNRDPQDIFKNDPLSVLDKVEKKAEKTLKEIGVRNVRDLKRMKAQELSVSEKNLRFFGPNAPASTDHCQALNPYESKYGPEWLDHLKASTVLFKDDGTQLRTCNLLHSQHNLLF